MKRLKPDKLHVRFLPGAAPEGPTIPRRYTLTHSDRTGALFLTIGPNYHYKQIRGWYTKWMRDEVLGEWCQTSSGPELRIYVHVSGGRVVGTAAWRDRILRREMPLVLEAIRYGERFFLRAHPERATANVCVHFQSDQEKYNVVESWGTLAAYRRSLVPSWRD